MAKRKANAEEVIALHANGQRTLQTVGDMVGLSHERVRQILAKHKVKTRRGHWVHRELQSPAWLKRRLHLTPKEVAAELGCDRQAIYDTAHKYNLVFKRPMRPFFNCGHPRTQENSTSNGGKRTRCTTCNRAGARASYHRQAAARRLDAAPGSRVDSP